MIIRPGRLAGGDALRIMVEEIGTAIGNRRLQAFERAVRLKVSEMGGGNAQDWIDAMALVIVENSDRQADEGFKRGIRRIREQAARQ